MVGVGSRMSGASIFVAMEVKLICIGKKKLNEKLRNKSFGSSFTREESNSVLLDQNYSLVCRRILRGSLQRWKDVSCWTLPLHKWKNWRHMRDNWYVFM